MHFRGKEKCKDGGVYTVTELPATRPRSGTRDLDRALTLRALECGLFESLAKGRMESVLGVGVGVAVRTSIRPAVPSAVSSRVLGVDDLLDHEDQGV